MDQKMEYLVKKTAEQCRKESEELTRKELDKLTHAIKNNPNLLRPAKQEKTYSDAEDDEDHPRVENDRAAERNYYLTLDLNNKMAEIADLQKEIVLLKKKEELFTLIQQIICFYEEIKNLTDYKKSSVLREITSNITEVNNMYQKKTGKINVMKKHLLLGLETFKHAEDTCHLLNHYNISLGKIQHRLQLYHERNINTLEQCVRNKQFYFHLRCYTSTMVVLFIWVYFVLFKSSNITDLEVY